MRVEARKPVVYFSYLDPKGFSGQRAATELVIRGLEDRGWTCFRLPQPALDRTDGARNAKLLYAVGVLRAWIRGLRVLFACRSWFCSNIPQTRVGMLRECVNLLVARVGVGRHRIVISLHGSLFMHWPPQSLEARLFVFLLAQAGTVTVLGEKQREHLSSLGVPEERVHVVVNSCELDPLDPDELTAKLTRPQVGAVRLLYLSSLIDTKGYPEFLEAIRSMAQSKDSRIQAVLCGKLLNSELNERFASSADAEAWIDRILSEINGSERASVRWVKGAVGREKRELFREADIFVLPSRYAVEAQPLVLLEAMACGCAIVTTRVGEIPTILDEHCAHFLDQPTVANLIMALSKLVESSEDRERIARCAHRRYLEQYRIERHIDAWESLLIDRPPETA